MAPPATLTFALNWFSSPFSCPTMMNSPRGPQTPLVILDSLQGIFMYGSSFSVDKGGWKGVRRHRPRA